MSVTYIINIITDNYYTLFIIDGGTSVQLYDIIRDPR